MLINTHAPYSKRRDDDENGMREEKKKKTKRVNGYRALSNADGTYAVRCWTLAREKNRHAVTPPLAVSGKR